MKNIVLSADGDSVVYAVPDTVADHLEEYCLEFCGEWLWHSPDSEKYRTDQGVSYTEKDFVDYLNTYVFPEEPSVPVQNLGWTGLGADMPAEYAALPYFNF